jgi:hypothetical protein
MTKLSLNQAWNETAAFVKREGRLLFPIALLLVALPMTAVRPLMPASGGPGEVPEPGAWLVVLALAIVVGMVGNLAIATLALRSGTSVAEALSNGLRRMPFLLAATLLIILATGAAAFLIILLFAILFGGGGSAPSPEAALRLAATTLIVLLPLGLYVFSRLIFTTPVAAVEQSGPLAIIRRSWQLSRGSVWTLIGFILLVAILFLVINLAVTAVVGILLALAAGPPEPGSLGAILMLIVDALLNTVIAVYMTVMVARLYAQLAGAASAEKVA